ncbi:rhodanese-like domain-containing protein [Flavobacterium sp. CYK-55]|uniref:rhodanese-like domain-containing protein n=1 Tax=Flavobacterium sp. CYK-55 TaxID=2835529 RepID=UPI001BD068A9|nr:rhodanese-like domain-containing protein [Flavobacterium sp. CYK-55]MBS7788189.1 rhodanese-like domain-containing protein [Flavobacterium sp. CYK-55]
MKHFAFFLLGLTLLSSSGCLGQKNTKTLYQCLPCGLDCDHQTYNKPGVCKDCNMKLVKASSIKFKNITPQKVCAYIAKHPKTILLDVRTAKEYQGKADPDFGSLKNAINIPIQELEKRIKELKRYQKNEILVYCSHSHRSPQAAYLLNQYGFVRVLNLSGGMSELQNGSCKK